MRTIPRALALLAVLLVHVSTPQAAAASAFVPPTSGRARLASASNRPASFPSNTATAVTSRYSTVRGDLSMDLSDLEKKLLDAPFNKPEKFPDLPKYDVSEPKLQLPKLGIQLDIPSASIPKLPDLPKYVVPEPKLPKLDVRLDIPGAGDLPPLRVPIPDLPPIPAIDELDIDIDLDALPGAVAKAVAEAVADAYAWAVGNPETSAPLAGGALFGVAVAVLNSGQQARRKQVAEEKAAKEEASKRVGSNVRVGLPNVDLAPLVTNIRGKAAGLKVDDTVKAKLAEVRGKLADANVKANADGREQRRALTTAASLAALLGVLSATRPATLEKQRIIKEEVKKAPEPEPEPSPVPPPPPPAPEVVEPTVKVEGAEEERPRPSEVKATDAPPAPAPASEIGRTKEATSAFVAEKANAPMEQIAPLVVAPFVALLAARSALRGTKERREKEQEEMGASEAVDADDDLVKSLEAMSELVADDRELQRSLDSVRADLEELIRRSESMRDDEDV